MSNSIKQNNETQLENFSSVSEILKENDFIQSSESENSENNSENKTPTLKTQLTANEIIQNRLKLIEAAKAAKEIDACNNEQTQLVKQEKLNHSGVVILRKSKMMRYKCDLSSLEYPFFIFKASKSLTREFRYGEMFITLKGNESGLATMGDKNVWIYLISKLVELKNSKEKISPIVHFTAYDFINTMKGYVGGQTYKELLKSLERLCGTRVLTNIKTGGEREKRNFGLIDSYRIVEKSEDDDTMISIEVTLPYWLFNSIHFNEIKTLSPEYFSIRKPIHKRIYEIGLKHCGEQQSFKIFVEKLFEKSGTVGDIRNFRRDLKELAELDNLPDYFFRYDEEEKAVYFINRQVKNISALFKKIQADKKLK